MPNLYNTFNTYGNSGILPVTLGAATAGPPGNTYGIPPSDYNDPSLGIGIGTSGPVNLTTGNSNPYGYGTDYNDPSLGIGIATSGPFNLSGGSNLYEQNILDWYSNQPALPIPTPASSFPGPNNYYLPGSWYEDDPNIFPVIPGTFMGGIVVQGTNTPGNNYYNPGQDHWYQNDSNIFPTTIGTNEAGPQGPIPPGNYNYWTYSITNGLSGQYGPYLDLNPPVDGTNTVLTAPIGLGYSIQTWSTDNNPFSVASQFYTPGQDLTQGVDISWVKKNLSSPNLFRGGGFSYPDTLSIVKDNRAGDADSQLKNVGTRVATSAIGLLPVDIDPFGDLTPSYSVLPFNKLYKPRGFKYQDFRSRIHTEDSIRLDGASASKRFGSPVSATAIAYAAATALPFGGTYSVFNLETTYGFGNQGSIGALRKDFTARSEAATNLNRSLIQAPEKPNPYEATKNLLERFNEFRGDKVNVIDFGKRTKNSIYKWKNKAGLLGGLNLPGALDPTITQDFIKFYFTGPKLHAGSDKEEDDVLVFRAILTNLNDSFQANWNETRIMGRGDPNYSYNGFSRDLSIDFTVYATDRDEMKPMYRKLNYLASYMAPEYSDDTIALVAPWLRITVGDLFLHQPAIISSMYYTFVDAETNWETNITKDPLMKQAPFKVEVNMQLQLITDYLPQKRGRMYSLAKEFDENGQPKYGENSDWLADAEETETKIMEEADAPAAAAGPPPGPPPGAIGKGG